MYQFPDIPVQWYSHFPSSFRSRQLKSIQVQEENNVFFLFSLLLLLSRFSCV